MRKLRFIFTLTLTLLLCGAASAQSEARDSVAFRPHWYLQPQVGVAHHRGEAPFGKLLSPTAALSFGYQFSPVWGLRLGASGWQARNWQAHPKSEYKWNYIQGNVDVTMSILNLIKKKPMRYFDIYAFIGGGANYEFNNDDCQALYAVNPDYYEKMWFDNRWNIVARGGLGLDIALSKAVALNLECNTNLLPDHFNSKKGRHDNRDWQTNLMLGLKIALGKTLNHYAIEPVVVPEPVPVEEPVVIEEPKVIEPVAPKVEQREPIQVDVYFVINKWAIRESEAKKLDELVEYMNKYPNDLVVLTGYADVDTGTHAINERLSIKRAAEVKKYLINAGIDESRITTDHKGDTVQPKNTPAENRVTICITEPK